MPRPVIHGRDHAPGGADPIPLSFGGIQYEIDPQTGGWLLIETDSTEGGGPTDDAIRVIANEGDIAVNAVAHDIKMISGNDILASSGRDLTWTADRDAYVTADRDAAIVANGDILLRANEVAGNLRLYNLPTADPGVSNAVWNDGGTLKISP
jgi:hypothetical protein